MIRLGTYADPKQDDLTVLCHPDDPLYPHRDKPWFKDWVAARESKGSRSLPAPSGDALVGEEQLRRHAFLLGRSGYGKTRLGLHMAAEQLKAGCSVVAIDLKDQTVLHLLDLARRMHFPPEDIVVMMPQLGRPPSWNPLDAESLGVTAEQAVNEFVELVDDVNARAPLLRDVMENAFLMAAAHRLSVYEAVHLLRDDRYREGLLSLPPTSGAIDDDTYREALGFFKGEFAVMPNSERKGAVSGVMRRLRRLVRDPFLRSVLCSRQPSFPLTSLWHCPKLFLVHLDPTEIGAAGAEVIGTLLVRQLFSAASRAGGKGGNPVVLFLDEIGRLQRFLGESPADILTYSRSYDLRVIAAAQVLELLEPGLREALLGNTSIQAFFNLSAADARAVGEWLGSQAGAGGPSRIEVEADEKARPERAAYPVTDGKGRPLSMTPDGWDYLQACAPWSTPPPLRALRNFVAASGFSAPAQAAGTRLDSLLEGVPGHSWRFLGPQLSLEVTFPRPKVKVLDGRSESQAAKRFADRISNLPKGECVLNLVSVSAPVAMVVTRVPDPPAKADPAYVAAALRSGQSDGEVWNTLEWRKERIRQTAEAAPEPQPASPGGARTAAPKAPPALKEEKPPLAKIAVPLAGEDDSV